jgi:large subunit ribosomal protein L15
MNLESLVPVKGSTSKRKRVGRGQGSGLGKTSGRGHGGSGQRSGNKKRAWFEGGQMSLARRLPKRGFTNIFKEKYQVVNIGDLSELKANFHVDPSYLQDNGHIRSSLKPVKILGNGEIKRKIKFSASAFSASAQAKIEKAGGEIIIL